MIRKRTVFVVASVILNVVLIGVIAGHSYHRYAMDREDRIVALLERSSLPEPQRLALQQKVRDVFHNEEHRREKKEWRQETLAVLTAEPFDAQAYRKQLEVMMERRQQHKAQVVDTMIEVVSALNQEERQALADIFRRSRGRGHDHR